MRPLAHLLVTGLCALSAFALSAFALSAFALSAFALSAFALSAFATGCGADPRAPGPPAPTLVDGEAVYPVRFNPPPCLTEGPEVSVEVATPSGWERVALEDADEDTPQVRTLLADFARAPGDVRQVRAKLTNQLRPYGRQHVARVLRLIELDPPDEAPP